MQISRGRNKTIQSCGHGGAAPTAGESCECSVGPRVAEVEGAGAMKVSLTCHVTECEGMR